MAGIGVQWALFDGGQSRKRAAALDRNRRATQEQRADVESMIALQVRQAWLLHERRQGQQRRRDRRRSSQRSNRQRRHGVSREQAVG